MATRRRAVETITAGLVALASGACGGETRPVARVALLERSLPYAPLILAIKQGLYATPPAMVALAQRATAADVAAAIAGGEVDLGALSLPSFLDAVEAGAPLVIAGALTRRISAHLLIASAAPRALTVDSLLSGGWRALRLGTQTGDVERFMRALWLTAGHPAPLTSPPYVPADPLAGEPRYTSFQTDAALVAALRDGRVDAVAGSAVAAAQSTVLGESRDVATFSTGQVAPDVAAAHAIVLVMRGDTASDQALRSTLASVARACARAAMDLAGTGGVAALQRALPDQDLLHLSLALASDSPDSQHSIFSLNAGFEPVALQTLAEVRARAGRPSQMDMRRLTAALA